MKWIVLTVCNLSCLYQRTPAVSFWTARPLLHFQERTLWSLQCLNYRIRSNQVPRPLSASGNGSEDPLRANATPPSVDSWFVSRSSKIAPQTYGHLNGSRGWTHSDLQFWVRSTTPCSYNHRSAGWLYGSEFRATFHSSSFAPGSRDPLPNRYPKISCNSNVIELKLIAMDVKRTAITRPPIDYCKTPNNINLRPQKQSTIRI